MDSSQLDTLLPLDPRNFETRRRKKCLSRCEEKGFAMAALRSGGWECHCGQQESPARDKSPNFENPDLFSASAGDCFTDCFNENQLVYNFCLIETNKEGGSYIFFKMF